MLSLKVCSLLACQQGHIVGWSGLKALRPEAVRIYYWGLLGILSPSFRFGKVSWLSFAHARGRGGCGILGRLLEAWRVAPIRTRVRNQEAFRKRAAITRAAWGEML